MFQLLPTLILLLLHGQGYVSRCGSDPGLLQLQTFRQPLERLEGSAGDQRLTARRLLFVLLAHANRSAFETFDSGSLKRPESVNEAQAELKKNRVTPFSDPEPSPPALPSCRFRDGPAVLV